jgi:hypothetical protein
LLNFDDTFETANVHHGSRIKHTTKEWREKIFSFTPTRSGEHHIELIPVTVGIPKLSFRISDPTKKDGRVLAGLLSKKLF